MTPVPARRSPIFSWAIPPKLTGTQLLDWARLRDLYAGAYFQDDWK